MSGFPANPGTITGNLTVSGTAAITGATTTTGVLTENGGTSTAGSAAVTSPAVSSGVAFTPNATLDAMVYMQLAAAAAGSYSLTMGPTTGAENTIGNAVAVAIGAPPLLTLRVPAGWKAVLTVTTITIAQTRVVTC